MDKLVRVIKKVGPETAKDSKDTPKDPDSKDTPEDPDRVVKPTATKAKAAKAAKPKTATKAKAATKKKNKPPDAYEPGDVFEGMHAHFIPPAQERNPPAPAPLMDAAFGAMEIESEVEEEEVEDDLLKEVYDDTGDTASVVADDETETDATDGLSATTSVGVSVDMSDDDGDEAFFSREYTPVWGLPQAALRKHKKEKKRKPFTEPIDFEL